MRDLFDKWSSERAKVDGMAIAAEAQPTVLELAQGIAIELAHEFGEVHADDVGRVMKKRHNVSTMGPAAGSIFKGEQWEFTGRRVRSVRTKNHGRELKVWRLKS